MAQNSNELQDGPKRATLVAQWGDFPLKIDTIALTSDGVSLAIAAPGSGISLWDIPSSTQQGSLDIPEEAFREPDLALIRDLASWVPVMVRSLTFSDDGIFMAAALTNQEVGIWLAEGTLLETIRCAALDLVFLPQTSFLMVCREDGWVDMWDTMSARLLSTGENVTALAGVPLSRGDLSHCCLTCSHDGKHLAAIASFSGTSFTPLHSQVFLWKLMQDHGDPAPVLQRTFPGPPDAINTVSYLSSDRSLFCSSYGDSVWEIDLQTDESNDLLPGKTLWPRPCCSSLSPDGRLVAVADMYGKVSIWNVLTRGIVFQFQAHEEVKQSIDAISAMTWLPDGERLITIGTSQVGNDQGKRAERKKLLPSFKHSTAKIWRIE